MAIQVNITTVLAANGQEASQSMYSVKEFLKTAGWTVAGSSDGTTGGMDAVDRIVSGDLLSGTDRWFVMQSPHVNAADRIQILFSKPSTQEDEGAISYNPNADYAGVTTAVPTSSYETLIHAGDLVSATTDIRFHMTADDASPYGFAVMGLTPGTNNASFSLACLPLDTQPTENPGKPYVIYAGGEQSNNYEDGILSTETAVSSAPRCMAEGQNPPQAPTISTACVLRSNASTQLVPLGSNPDINGKDQTHPVIFQTTGAFYGTTSFMRWLGTARNRLDTLEDDVLGVRGRIVFGDVCFPWDGVTVPDKI